MSVIYVMLLRVLFIAAHGLLHVTTSMIELIERRLGHRIYQSHGDTPPMSILKCGMYILGMFRKTFKNIS